MKVKFTMPQNSGLRADFNTDEYHTIATKAELNAEIEARIEGDNDLQSEIARVENEIPDISGLATKAELQAVEDEIPDISNLATKTELQEVENEIPVVNNGTLTIKQEGETIGVFRANDSNNVIVDIESGGAVDSVNGQTGVVVLTASDVGALPNTTVIPTKTSDLTNDSNFITKAVNDLTNYYLKSETYTKQEVNQLIADIPKFTVTIVQELPLIGQPMVLYLVPKDGESPDIYNEYIWITSSSSYELIGTTAVDLDGYATEVYVDNGLATKQDVLTAGNNISITNNIISATDTTYTAGEGISIENGVISNTQTSAEWGNIQGDISNQTDLQTALNTKQGILTAGTDLEIVTIPDEDDTVSGTTSVVFNSVIADGLNSVTLFGACEQTDDVLPSGYTRLDYVTCTSNSRIDTDIIGDQTTVIKARFRVPELQNMYVYACQHSSNTRGITSYITPTVGNWRFGDQTTTIGFEANKWYETIQSATGISVNGTLYPYGEVNEFTTPYTIILGTSHASTGGYGTAYFRGDLGEFSIEKGGVLVANYIPCKNNSTNKYGFYDTISETFKASETVNAFTAGETLPTPHNPVPIKCNNGIIKIRKSGLPSGYTQVEYLECTGTQWLDTGFIANDGMVVDAKVKPVNNYMYIGSIIQSSPNTSRNLIWYSSDSYSLQKLDNYNTKYVDDGTNPAIIHCDTTGTKIYCTINGVEIINTTTTGTLTNQTNTVKISFSDFGSTVRTGRYYYVIIHNSNGELVKNLIPCRRNSDSVLGMYDTVSGNFLTNAGTGTFIAGNNIPDIEIYTDGTVETVTDSENNTATSEMLLAVGDIKDEQSILDGVVTRKIGIKVFDGTEDWSIQNTYNFSITKTSIGTNTTALPNYSLKMQSNYFQTANYATKNNSVWSGNTYINFRAVETFTTIENWKAWVAEKYNSGNPVILLYPLANTTTQTVTGQTLTTIQGTNTITTIGSIEDLPIEVNYITSVREEINFTNDTGYTTNTGTVTSVNNIQPDGNGNVTVPASIPTNMVTTNTDQDISGIKTFIGAKRIKFKQATVDDKLGFTLYNPSNTELGALEYRPNTINSASLLNLNCPQVTGGYVGFRYWANQSPGVNIIAPKVATAGNYYIPINITNGTKTVTSNSSGTVNINSLLPTLSDVAAYISTEVSTNSLKIGNTTLNETQLQALLNLI